MHNIIIFFVFGANPTWAVAKNVRLVDPLLKEGVGHELFVGACCRRGIVVGDSLEPRLYRRDSCLLSSMAAD